ncbi:MAG TPA: glutathione S-transferase family protein [Allosphingosinicella sp.]|jgi:glutathione S-transferase|nr:glutathione S-transferase family protein [Allosphingosinicella sp.]
MITLFNATLSRSTRILWLLEELGAPYELVPVSIARPDGSGGPDPANPHPLKQVPCILDGDELIVESLAIWMHLGDAFSDAQLAPPLGHPKRAEYVGWLGLATSVFEPLMSAALAGAALDGRQETARDFLAARIEAALSRRPWLLWERFSVVDLVYGSLLRFAPDVLGASAAIEAWLARLSERSALARVRAKEGRG